METDYTIFLDMDGVLCSFLRAFETFKTGLSPDAYETKYGSKKYWDLINSKGVDFWSDIDPLPDMNELKSFVFDNFLRIGILSSSSKKNSGTNYAEIGKRIWLEKHGFTSVIPDSYIHIVPSAQDKKKFASSDRILVDDYPKNITGWTSSGGVGILHKSAKNTIKELTPYV